MLLVGFCLPVFYLNTSLKLQYFTNFLQYFIKICVKINNTNNTTLSDEKLSTHVEW